MAIVGIDGNQWYISNGICLGDPRARYAFADTLEEAIALYFSGRDYHVSERVRLEDTFRHALRMKPEQYQQGR